MDCPSFLGSSDDCSDGRSLNRAEDLAGMTAR